MLCHNCQDLNMSNNLSAAALGCLLMEDQQINLNGKKFGTAERR